MPKAPKLKTSDIKKRAASRIPELLRMVTAARAGRPDVLTNELAGMRFMLDAWIQDFNDEEDARMCLITWMVSDLTVLVGALATPVPS